jgi:hypothetical protein
MNKAVLGLGCGGQQCDSSMLSAKVETGGVRKAFRSMTGSSRRRLLEQQAARAGRTPEDLLCERKDRKQAWQSQKMHLKNQRCPNCGYFGHNYHWCPFTLPVFLEQKDRFRGIEGRWGDNEMPLPLSQIERERMSKHFAILCMRLESTQFK